MRLQRRSRAFVKAQDGCDMRCAYCVVPSVRSRLSCKPFATLEAEVRSLVAAGYREIVLCGIRLGRYLVEVPGGRRMDFLGMLERLLTPPGDFRIRLSSLEITDITGRFVDLFEGSGGRLCPSFHLPLQSGSETVLRRMNRWYSVEFYARRLSALKSRLPEAGVFTDVMVGYPGETEREAADSFEFVRGCGFSGLHVFRYSRRAGTPAAERSDHLPDGTVLERAERMRALDRGLRRDFAAAAVGSRRRVLVETRGSRPVGMTDHFLRVVLDRDPGPGLHWARIVSAEGAAAQAEVMASGCNL
ncbi:MAG: radical SAM protein [Elusimicrobiota bacterium]